MTPYNNLFLSVKIFYFFLDITNDKCFNKIVNRGDFYKYNYNTFFHNFVYYYFFFFSNWWPKKIWFTDKEKNNNYYINKFIIRFNFYIIFMEEIKYEKINLGYNTFCYSNGNI